MNNLTVAILIAAMTLLKETLFFTLNEGGE